MNNIKKITIIALFVFCFYGSPSVANSTSWGDSNGKNDDHIVILTSKDSFEYKKEGEINFNVKNVKFSKLMEIMSKSYKIHISASQEIDINKKVVVKFENLSPIWAIHKIAQSVGYSSIYNPENNHIKIVKNWN